MKGRLTFNLNTSVNFHGFAQSSVTAITREDSACSASNMVEFHRLTDAPLHKEAYMAKRES